MVANGEIGLELLGGTYKEVWWGVEGAVSKEQGRGSNGNKQKRGM